MKSDTLKHGAIGSILALAVVSTVFVVVRHSSELQSLSALDDPYPANSFKKPERLQGSINTSANAINTTSINPRAQTESNNNAAEHETTVSKSVCTTDCLHSLTEKISAGMSLDSSELIRASDHAQELADLLEQNPDQIVTFETSLSVTNKPAERDLFLYILSKLPKEQLLQSAQRLNYSSKPEDRIAGLSLLESSIGSDRDFGQELTTLISNESNEQVLVRAIRIVDELPPDAVDTLVHTKLSSLIERSDNEQIISAALLAKTSLVLDDEDIREDISSLLLAESDNLNLTGLQALGQVLERQQYAPERGDWRQRSEIRKDVLAIANNTDASPMLRIEALNLMHRHFFDDQ